MISTPPRNNVLGVGINVLNLPSATDLIIKAAQHPGFTGYVTVTGVHGVMESQADEELKKIHNKSFLSTPDGMPMVWLGHFNGFSSMDRVYGPDLMETICKESCATGLRHYLFGGAEGVAEKLKRSLERHFPGIPITGFRTPPFRVLTPEEELALVSKIKEAKPHFFWVGLSTPKQERFMHGFLQKYSEELTFKDHGIVFLGVGAAFDFHAGLLIQAPRWIQRSGFEWLFRFIMEPRRLWRRYTFNNVFFIKKILPQMMGLRDYPFP